MGDKYRVPITDDGVSQDSSISVPCPLLSQFPVPLFTLPRVGAAPRAALATSRGLRSRVGTRLRRVRSPRDLRTSATLSRDAVPTLPNTSEKGNRGPESKCLCFPEIRNPYSVLFWEYPLSPYPARAQPRLPSHFSTGLRPICTFALLPSTIPHPLSPY